MSPSKKGKKPGKLAAVRADEVSKLQPIAETARPAIKSPVRKAETKATPEAASERVVAKPAPERAVEEKAAEAIEAESPLTAKVTAAIADVAAAAKAEIKVQAAPSADRVESVKPIAPKGVEGAKVSEKLNGEKVFESFTKLGESFFSVDGVKKAAAWYIETSEKLAHQAIELSEKSASWAKETPLAPLFEAQTSMAKKFVERSASAARNLWQIQAHHHSA